MNGILRELFATHEQSQKPWEWSQVGTKKTDYKTCVVARESKEINGDINKHKKRLTINETIKSEDTTSVHAHLHRSQHKNEQKHTISVDGCVVGCCFPVACLFAGSAACYVAFLFICVVWCAFAFFYVLCVLWSVMCPSQFLVSWRDFWYVACAFCISMLVLFVD